LGGETRFAFVSIEEASEELFIKKQSQWYACRGFLCEGLFGSRAGNTVYSSGSGHSDIGKYIHNGAACLLVTSIGEENLRAVVEFLNKYHATYGWEPSFYVTLKNGVFLLVSSGKWFASVAYLSLYLFLIRSAKRVCPTQEGDFKSWLSCVRENPNTRQDDKITIYSMYKKYNNVVELMMEFHDVLTEADNLDDYRLKYQQQEAHSAGIQNLVETAYTLRPDTYENSLEQQRRTISLNRGTYGPPAFKIHPHATLRLAVVLQVYGQPNPTSKV